MLTNLEQKSLDLLELLFQSKSAEKILYNVIDDYSKGIKISFKTIFSGLRFALRHPIKLKNVIGLFTKHKKISS